ncbi:MAG: FAD binding domain-containing protein [Planctomycetales bacterium]|nr:FAD binding domain-containing protein [Planctomycetales bacterium]
MKNFEYAQPRSEAEAVTLLSEPGRKSAVLAGGTDLIGLMNRGVESPERIVNIREIRSLQSIDLDADGNLWVGAAASLDDFFDAKQADSCPSVKQIIAGISSPQLRAQGTVVGELLRRPTCWYFRSGHGLLARDGKMVVDGDNRYHAILDNRGYAKFVSASRIAPALISLGAHVRVLGPGSGESEHYVELERLFRKPEKADDVEHALQPGQLVTHIVIPPQHGRLAAAYEVRQGEGPDQPLAACAVNLQIEKGKVQWARIVLGQVAPTPWIARDAASSLIGFSVDEQTAARVSYEAVAHAMSLSHNEYKIQLAAVAVKRALLKAVGQDVGDFSSCAVEEYDVLA